MYKAFWTVKFVKNIVLVCRTFDFFGYYFSPFMVMILGLTQTDTKYDESQKWAWQKQQLSVTRASIKKTDRSRSDEDYKIIPPSWSIRSGAPNAEGFGAISGDCYRLNGIRIVWLQITDYFTSGKFVFTTHKQTDIKNNLQHAISVINTIIIFIIFITGL